jgi:hypothetical protein
LQLKTAEKPAFLRVEIDDGEMEEDAGEEGRGDGEMGDGDRETE